MSSTINNSSKAAFSMTNHHSPILEKLFQWCHDSTFIIGSYHLFTRLRMGGQTIDHLPSHLKACTFGYFDYFVIYIWVFRLFGFNSKDAKKVIIPTQAQTSRRRRGTVQLQQKDPTQLSCELIVIILVQINVLLAMALGHFTPIEVGPLSISLYFYCWYKNIQMGCNKIRGNRVWNEPFPFRRI